MVVQAQSIETIIQKGHELAVLAVAPSPDSNFVATGSKDKSAKLWEVSTGREVRSFLGHEASVTSLTFSPDGQFLITGSNDKSVRIWRVAQGKEIYKHQTTEYITDVTIDPQGRFYVFGGIGNSGYADTAYVCDWQTHRTLAKIPIDPDKGLGRGVDIAISADGKFLAIGEDNRVAQVYRTSDWSPVKKIFIEDGFCGGCATWVAFSPDTRFLYMASNNGEVKKLDLSTFATVQVYSEKEEDLTGFSISRDGKYIAAANEKQMKVWDTQSGKLADTRDAEEKAEYNRIAFSQNSNELLATSNNNTAFVWQVKQHKLGRIFTGFLNDRDRGGLNYDYNFYWESAIARHIRFKNNILITPDGKSLLKGKFGTKVRRWDVASGKVLMEFSGHEKAVLCYALSRDGKRLLTGGGDGKIILWDVATGDSLRVMRSYREPIFDIHFNSDETQVISSSWDATLRMHDLSTGKRINYTDFKNSSVYSMVLHTSDLYVITARLDNTLEMLEMDTHDAVRRFVGHTENVTSVRLSRDQRTLLSAGWDATIRLWDVGTGLMTRKFREHQGAVHVAVYGPDEKYIYSAGADRVIRVWDVATGKVVRRFEGHLAEVTALLFSPDNKMLISHSVDGVTKFWDLDTGREFFEHIHLGDRDWMVKSPEGYFNGTDDARKYIHFVNGMKTYAVDQFFQDFYRPDLLPKIFQNRGERDERKGIQGKLNSSPPPTVKVAVLPAGERKAEVYVRITDNGAGVQQVRLLHNGKSLALQQDQLKFPSTKGQSTTYKQTIDLIGGTNTFTAVAVNRDQLESDPHSAEIFSDHASKSSTCYILAVGINQYKNGKLNLNYARPDAESFSKVLGDKGPHLFKNIELQTLFDGEATRQNILSKLEEMGKKIHQEDVFIFYYAGHGSMVDNKFYFIPSESSRLYESSSLQKEAIEASLVQDKLKHIKALKQLIVMDACQSGASVELLATRGASEEKAIAQLSRSAGIHVMASAGSEQFATEFAELGHGLFTYVLIKALEGDADGAPRDGKVTIYELKSYIDDQVPEMTRKLKGKPQYPYTFSRGQDFPIVIE